MNIDTQTAWKPKNAFSKLQSTNAACTKEQTLLMQLETALKVYMPGAHVRAEISH